MDNGSLLPRTSINLADVTATRPAAGRPRNGLETALHVGAQLGANFLNVLERRRSDHRPIPVINNFANPNASSVGSSIQAGICRLGYQDFRRTVRAVLAPILDAIKFNFAPSASISHHRRHLAQNTSPTRRPRLQPATGLQGHHRARQLWSRDTLFSHGNHEPGWIVAPGNARRRRAAVQRPNMLTRNRWRVARKGPTLRPPRRNDAPRPAELPMTSNNPLPPPWYPQPLRGADACRLSEPLRPKRPLGAQCPRTDRTRVSDRLAEVPRHVVAPMCGPADRWRTTDVMRNLAWVGQCAAAGGPESGTGH